mmetsp:Transcript_65180/g.124313  ORF Transcript_65180/g.124313 Transcript_65180/m.124313 type:complete len:409 (-) Transcript_65180:48-1274(-)
MGQKVTCCSRRSGEAKPVIDAKSSGFATDATGSDAAPAEDGRSAAEWKEKGNQHFKRREFFSAIAAYNEAIRLSPEDGTYWLNRAIAHRQLSGWQEALSDASRAVELQPGSEKALYTKACALEKLLRVPEALEACKAGLKLNPDNKTLLQLQQSLQEKQVGKTEQPRKADTSPAGKKPSAPAPKPKRNAAGKIDYSVDYSKWANFEDSDEEVEQGTAPPPIPVPEPEEAEPEPTAKHFTKSARADLKAEMMKLAYKMRKDVTGELGLEQGRRSEIKELPDPVGVITVEELANYGCSNDRRLTSLYGDVFDVSDHPDEYGSGPKALHPGKDVTWVVVTEKDVAENLNRFYDIFKLEHKKLQGALQVICNKLAVYQEKFGQPVGRLDVFDRESALPAPPAGEGPEQCPVM